MTDIYVVAGSYALGVAVAALTFTVPVAIIHGAKRTPTALTNFVLFLVALAVGTLAARLAYDLFVG